MTHLRAIAKRLETAQRPRITHRERDVMMADIRALMAKHRLCPHTLHKLAEVANREATAHLEIGLCIAQQAAQ